MLHLYKIDQQLHSCQIILTSTFCAVLFSFLYFYYHLLNIARYVMLDDGNVKNSAKKFPAAKLLKRKDTFYRNLLAVVKSYHRVFVKFLRYYYEY